MKNNLKKTYNSIIATALSIGILGNSTVSAACNSENKLGDFIVKHPVISTGVSIIGASTVAAGTVLVSTKLYNAIRAYRMHTYVDKMTEEEVKTKSK